MSPLELPANALVMLVGAAASGKSSWARACFSETEVVSSDRCRALVSDDETRQDANREAFAVFYRIIAGRAALGRLTVADSTALQPFSRARLQQIAARAGVPHHAVVFLTPFPVLRERNLTRERRVPEPILEKHALEMERILADSVLEGEGYAGVHYLTEPVPVVLTPPVWSAPAQPLPS